MTIRERFERKLKELDDDILKMGSMVEDELKTALQALEGLDTNLANKVFHADRSVNKMRYDIEEKCFALIVTQQPAASDLRSIVAVMNMIIDLERMGDQTKSIAKVVPHIMEYPNRLYPDELKEMGVKVGSMLNKSMKAYATDNIELARLIAAQDDEVDKLYVQVYSQIMTRMADTKKTKKLEATYENLRVAQKLERFGDLATNIAERIIYRVTGQFDEMNVDEDDIG